MLRMKVNGLHAVLAGSMIAGQAGKVRCQPEADERPLGYSVRQAPCPAYTPVMVEDNHYIANSDNAHIDTSAFENEAHALLTDFTNSDATLDSIYDLVIAHTNDRPTEPDDCQLICRYLSPDKFLQRACPAGAKWGVVFSWVLLFYSGHPALRPADQLRCSYALLRVCGQAKEKCPGPRSGSERLCFLALQDTKTAETPKSLSLSLTSPAAVESR